MSGTRDTEMAVGCQHPTAISVSMSGTRDTEIAVGCWQPQFNAYAPYGDVHMFRMSLWAEHLRTWEEGFRFPGTLNCTKRVKELCWANWRSYNYDKYDLPVDEEPLGQLLTYPIEVNDDGEISNLEDFKSFPDYDESAKVFGGKHALIPD